MVPFGLVIAIHMNNQFNCQRAKQNKCKQHNALYDFTGPDMTLEDQRK